MKENFLIIWCKFSYLAPNFHQKSYHQKICQYKKICQVCSPSIYAAGIRALRNCTSDATRMEIQEMEE